MRRLLLVCLLFVAGCGPAEPPPTADPVSLRTPPAGPVVGSAGLHGGHAWRGIPYAAPPSGDLRWRAPRAAEPWTGTREALAFGPRCPQFASDLEGSGDPGTRIGEEDCLHLNVYAPAFAPDAVPAGDARLPVMLWIHGGGNTIGASSFYDGSHLASARDLVVVTVNYRLGPLGWFRHASLRGDGTTPEDRSGNFGTLDLVRALQWVQENVAAFGGDPGNVTVFGESAGARTTFSMVVSPQAKGLFHRAIVQSGGVGLTTPAEAENTTDAAEPGAERSSGEVLLRWAESEGAADRAAAKAKLAAMDDAEIAATLRGLSLDALFALYARDAGPAGMVRIPQLFREPVVLPLDEYEAFASGRYNRVPIITGSNRDENKLFLAGDPELVDTWFGFLPRLRDAERYERIADYMSRGWKAEAVDGVAPLLVAHQGASVFAYRFDWDELPTIFGSDLAQIYGAAHAFEIPFVFGHFDLGRRAEVMFDDDNEPGRLELSNAMTSYWAEFAYSGDPGRGRAGDLPHWTAWDATAPERDKYLVFDTSEDGGLRMAHETVDLRRVLAEVRSDDLLGETERCELADRIVDWYGGGLGDEGRQFACAAHPEAGGTAGGE
ncbi:MAG: carboxylesterase/lipase family protein [Myxococcota bacterium]